MLIADPPHSRAGLLGLFISVRLILVVCIIVPNQRFRVPCVRRTFDMALTTVGASILALGYDSTLKLRYPTGKVMGTVCTIWGGVVM